MTQYANTTESSYKVHLNTNSYEQLSDPLYAVAKKGQTWVRLVNVRFENKNFHLKIKSLNQLLQRFAGKPADPKEEFIATH